MNSRAVYLMVNNGMIQKLQGPNWFPVQFRSIMLFMVVMVVAAIIFNFGFYMGATYKGIIIGR